MLASQLRHHAWTADSLAADLSAARDRQPSRSNHLSVAAAFGLSYADLAEGQQRLFRRLGLPPGPTFDAYAAAALDHTSLDEARRGLEGLYDQHLLTEPAPGHYQLHDLLREHARALAAAEDPGESDEAIGRLLAYYLHTAWPGRHFATWAAAYRAPATRRCASACPETSTLGRRPPGWKPSAPICIPPRTAHPAAGPCTRCRSRSNERLPAQTRSLGSSAALHQTALTVARQAGDPADGPTLNTLGALRRRPATTRRYHNAGPGIGALP
jgi:hypothetical protein